MTLLFKTTQTEFATQFKDALGFVDADFSARKMLPDVRSATTGLIELISQEVYDEIVAIDAQQNPQDLDLDLLMLARTAIATQAYASFAPVNDLQHGVTGRKMLTSGDSKTPFEHMIVKSDDELERRAYKTIDDLLKHLDQHNDTWKASDEFKDANSLFVNSVKQFNEYFRIDSRLLLLKLKPGIVKAEREEILSRIGSTRFASIKAKLNLSSQEPLLDLEQDLLPFIREACVYKALSWGIPRLQANLFPKGVLQPVRGDRATINGRVPFEGNQIDQLSQLFSEDADKSLIEIEKLITADEALDESYEEVSDEDIEGMINFSCDDKSVST